MEERYKVCITVGLILINKNNEVLLGQRCNTGYMDGYFALVAGHIEKGESLKQAMIREAKEEIGISIEERNLDFVSFIRRKNDESYINTYFKCEKYDGNIIINEPDKCLNLKWFKINELPNNILPNDKRAIENMNSNMILDEYDF